MAVLKHIAIKNADYSAALTYLKYKHDEFHLIPLLDENGNMMMRDEFYLDGINCCAETFDLECKMLNDQYHKNQEYDEIKTHHYIISFDSVDKDECGLTGEQAQAIGTEYARKNFPGHQALVCTHMDGHNGSGNIHVHIIINSLRKFDVEQEAYAERSIDRRAGYKQHLTDDHLKHLQQSLMDICLRENLNQVDLLNPAASKITKQEYYAKQRGQANLDNVNAEIVADGLTPMQTTFQTEEEKIREVIIAAAKESVSFEEFQKLLQSEFGIAVKDHRGRFSYLSTGRGKYISARSLGSNFDREHLLRLFEENAITAKNSAHENHKDKPPAILFIRSNLRFVNSQNCVKAQQSRAYAQKVKISNLQQMANTIAYIQEHGYDTEVDLRKACDQLSDKMAQSRTAMETTTADLKAVNEKIHYTGQYLSSKAIYSRLLKATNKKSFREEHAEEIAKHAEALRFLKQHSPDGKFAAMKELRAEKAFLLAKRTEQYQTYTYFKDYHKELQTVCSNVDMILYQTVTQEAKCNKATELS